MMKAVHQLAQGLWQCDVISGAWLTKFLLIVYAALDASHRKQGVYLQFGSKLSPIKAQQKAGRPTQIAHQNCRLQHQVCASR